MGVQSRHQQEAHLTFHMRTHLTQQIKQENRKWDQQQQQHHNLSSCQSN